MAGKILFPQIVDAWWVRNIETHIAKTSGRAYEQISDKKLQDALEELIMTCRNAGYDREHFEPTSVFNTVMEPLKNPTAKGQEANARRQIIYTKYKIARARVFAEEMNHLFEAAVVPLQKKTVEVPEVDPNAPKSDDEMRRPDSDPSEVSDREDDLDQEYTPLKPKKERELIDPSIFKDLPPVVRDVDEEFLAELGLKPETEASDE